MKEVRIIEHPLIQHKLALIRQKDTGVKLFREIIGEIAALMCFDATKDLPLEEIEIETSIAKTKAKVIAGKKLAIVPILRAGLGMVDGVLSVMPCAKVGHIGLYRDPETHKPVEYYCKLPKDVQEREVIVLDPMLATGGSASAAIGFIKKHGAKNIKLMCIISCPEGIKKLSEEHPDVEILCAALDSHLNENMYIVPGLGDAGDRVFGTK